MLKKIFLELRICNTDPLKLKEDLVNGVQSSRGLWNI